MKLRWLSLLFPIRIVLAVLVLFFIWQAWVFLRPKPVPLSVAEVNAARAAARSAAESIRAAAPEGRLRVGVAHFWNDPTDVVTELVKIELARQPNVAVEAGSLFRKFLNDVARAVGEATSLDEVVHAGRRVGLDVIVAGRVLGVESVGSSEGRAVLQVYAYDCRTGAWLRRDTFEGEWRPNIGQRLAGRVLGWSAWSRFLLWLAAVLALPWITTWGTLRAIERKSNFASFLLILIYTMIGLALAIALSGFRVVSGGAWWRFFAALAFCALYNFWACERIAAKSK